MKVGFADMTWNISWAWCFCSSNDAQDMLRLAVLSHSLDKMPPRDAAAPGASLVQRCRGPSCPPDVGSPQAHNGKSLLYENCLASPIIPTITTHLRSMLPS
eukprot:4332443-Amphidinium_carterae.2